MYDSKPKQIPVNNPKQDQLGCDFVWGLLNGLARLLKLQDTKRGDFN